MSRKILITKENYEIFAVDYCDGNLSGQEEKAFLAFLEQHPEIKEEVELFFDAAPLAKPAVRFSQKNQLKQKEIKAVAAIDEENYEEYFIAALEDDLNADGRKNLSEFLRQNVHLQKEFALTQKLKIAPDKQTVFPAKAQLKHKKPMRRYLYYGISSAAAALLILFLFRLGNPNETSDTTDFGKEIATPSVSDETLENILEIEEETVAELSEDLAEYLSENQPAERSPITKSRRIVEPVSAIAMREPELIPSQQRHLAIAMPLQPEQILLRNVNIEELEMLAKGEPIDSVKNTDEKNGLWNFLTWSAKKYNQITGEQIKVVKVENGEDKTVAYFVE